MQLRSPAATPTHAEAKRFIDITRKMEPLIKNTPKDFERLTGKLPGVLESLPLHHKENPGTLRRRGLQICKDGVTWPTLEYDASK